MKKLKRESEYVRTFSAQLHLKSNSSNYKKVITISKEYNRILNLYIEYFFKNWDNEIEITEKNQKTKELVSRIEKISELSDKGKKSKAIYTLFDNQLKFNANLIQSIANKAYGIVDARFKALSEHEIEFQNHLNKWYDKMDSFINNLIEAKDKTNKPNPPKLLYYHPFFNKDTNKLEKYNVVGKSTIKDKNGKNPTIRKFNEVPYYKYNDFSINNYGPMHIFLDKNNLFLHFNPSTTLKPIIIPINITEKRKQILLENLTISTRGRLYHKNKKDNPIKIKQTLKINNQPKDILSIPSITINPDNNRISFPITYENKSPYWDKINLNTLTWVAVDPGTKSILNYLTSDNHKGHYSLNGITNFKALFEKLIKIKSLKSKIQRKLTKYPDNQKLITILENTKNSYTNTSKQIKDLINQFVNDFYKNLNYQAYFVENNKGIKNNSKSRFNKSTRKRLEISFFDFLLNKLHSKGTELGKVFIFTDSYYNSIKCHFCGHLEKNFKYKFKYNNYKIQKDTHNNPIYDLDSNGNKIPVLAKDPSKRKIGKEFNYKKGEHVFTLDGNRPNGAEIFQCKNKNCNHTEHSDLHSCRNIAVEGINILTNYQNKKK